jgi:hypothetical protein
MSDYLTPAEFIGNGEEVQSIMGESSDYVPYELLPPSDEYVSNVRALKFANKVDKRGVPYVSVEVSVENLIGPNGEEIKLQRPLRTWISTLQFAQRNRPGTTSSVGSYLSEAGYNPKELKGDLLIEALNESATIPMKVVLGWTNMTKRTTNPDGTFSYSQEWAKTADFNKGTKEEPNFVTSIEKDGETVKAKHRIVAFRKI